MLNTTKNSEMPTKLGSASRFALVSPDKLSVKYTTEGTKGHGVGAVQANKPAPVNGTVFYFEIRVKNGGSKHCIAIGFTKDGYDLTSQPGWNSNSIGYHGDDGKLFRDRAEAFGPTFTTNDVVGAGIKYASNEFFFTKNGELVGTVSKNIDGPLFPTIGLHSQNEEVEVNFGQRPFAFDIKKLFPSQIALRDEIKPSEKMVWKEKYMLMEEKMKQMERELCAMIEDKDKEIASLKKDLKALNVKYYDMMYRI